MSDLLERGGRVTATMRPARWSALLVDTRKKLQCEALFKPPDRVAQGRLRHAQLRRGPREAALLAATAKRRELVQFALHDL